MKVFDSIKVKLALAGKSSGERDFVLNQPEAEAILLLIDKAHYATGHVGLPEDECSCLAEVAAVLDRETPDSDTEGRT